MDCGGWEWNTIRNILIANTDVENRRKLLVFIMKEHYNTRWTNYAFCANVVVFTDGPPALWTSFQGVLPEIKEINIVDSTPSLSTIIFTLYKQTYT